MIWKCVDCGHEEDERWLMCPNCTTPGDWAEMVRSATSVSCAVLHLDAEGNVIPCPGYPHAPSQPLRSAAEEQEQSERSGD